jgi:hypothetical protein
MHLQMSGFSRRRLKTPTTYLGRQQAETEARYAHGDWRLEVGGGTLPVIMG